ncbi:polysaccharide deacetylase family protein [Pseudanabaenaceae cyanobacterium LEGE 13415]|nr:polysaccharide deacetylase family protein [Pseudanabaenaceae cyanobacterium LEGE 13415]
MTSIKRTPQQRLVIRLARTFPEAVFYKETSEKVVALTIDDVPTPNETNDESTQLILDAIALHNQSIESERDRVRATFFIISNHLFDGTTLLDRMVEQGHEIGNHGVEDQTTHIFPGAILVLHGGTVERSRQTAQALPLILDDLKQRNYRIVTLSELWNGLKTTA